MFCDQVQVFWLFAAVDLAILHQIMETKQFSWDAPNNQLKDHPPPGARAWNNIELDEAMVHNCHQHGIAFESINFYGVVHDAFVGDTLMLKCFGKAIFWRLVAFSPRLYPSTCLMAMREAWLSTWWCRFFRCSKLFLTSQVGSKWALLWPEAFASELLTKQHCVGSSVIGGDQLPMVFHGGSPDKLITVDPLKWDPAQWKRLPFWKMGFSLWNLYPKFF